MRRSRSGALVAVVLVLLASTSCATRIDSLGGSATPRASATSTDWTECEHTGFALSLARNKGGQPTPLAAAVQFGDHGGVPGYQVPGNKWVPVPNPTASQGEDVDGMTLRADRVFLHVVQLTDDTWVVDSGGHCATPG